ncbi:sialate O-acetylesterase [Pollutibacter soli]|uniref:sialate O-acetylesterase n=1 Tax=Pollutibacter soli TaxID=3034157 RepID=UPI0030141B2E
MKSFFCILLSLLSIQVFSQTSKKDNTTKKTDQSVTQKPPVRVAKPKDTLFVDAGNDQSLSPDTKSTLLCAKVKTPTGEIKSYSWAHLYGPGTPAFSNAEDSSTNLTNLKPGTHRIEVTVTDATGHIAKDRMNIVIPSGPFVDTVFVYISGGQSNADGRAHGDSLPYRNKLGQVPGVEIFNWPDRTMRPYEVDRYNGGASVGVPRFWGGDIVVKKVFDSIRLGNFGDSVVHFKCTLGGTSIGPYRGATGNWIVPQDSVVPGKIRITDSLVTRWAAFKAMWNGRGYFVKPVVLMWHQGEGDVAMGSLYRERTDRLFTFFRENVFEDPHLPIVMGSIPSNSRAFNREVESAKRSMSVNDPNIYTINLDGVPMHPDNLHITAAGQIYFGNEMYRIIKNFAR